MVDDARSSCDVTPGQTEGPFYLGAAKVRRDITEGTDAVYSAEPYSVRGDRGTSNEDDGVLRGDEVDRGLLGDGVLRGDGYVVCWLWGG